MRYGQLVVGPAGSGKSTYCSTVQRHAADNNREIRIVNLDPAAEYFDYEPFVDVRELIQLDDPMEDDQMKFGPNGALVFCIEYLVENSSWLEEHLGDVDDDYVLFDCPGQIELYTHMTVVRRLITILQNLHFRMCAVFLIDSQFMVDASKFLSGTTAALGVMINLELPHINILSKMDLVPKAARKRLDEYLEPDPRSLLDDMEKDSWNDKYRNLTEALGRLVEDYGLVKFYPLDIKDEESIADIELTIDNMIQYGEERDVKTRDFDQSETD